MVTWYGLIPMKMTQNLEHGDHWLDPEEGWKKYTPRGWEELKDEQV